MEKRLVDLVWRRAEDRCEYCLLPQEATPYFTFHVEHIVAQQHTGNDNPSNLALSCNRCNAYKGPNLSSIDPDTQQVVQLFNRRADVWQDHFMLQGGEVVGLTPTGRATVRLFNMHAQHRVELREEWLKDADLS